MPSAHLVLTPRTGRTHQIRAHLQAIGHPILGDLAYGAGRAGLLDECAVPRVMLHAKKLGFQHPVTELYYEYAVKAPADFRMLYDALHLATLR